MKPNFLRRSTAAIAILAIAVGVHAASNQPSTPKTGTDTAQIPKWSADDLDFFLHGSMSTEVVPEPVLRAFIKIYPDLFPQQNLAYLGLIPDPKFDLARLGETFVFAVAMKPNSTLQAVSHAIHRSFSFRL
jgi:hypothetical protein